MNQQEYTALFAENDISHEERSLYVYLRQHMDFATGLVGQVRRISYQGIREHLEYIPPVGSHAREYRPSRDQVKRMLNNLVRRGWLVPIHKATHGAVAMVFSLPLATSDAVRPQEERHRSATGAPRYNPQSTRVVPFPATQKQGQERHTSVYPYDDDLCAREQLQFGSEWVLLAKQSQLVLPADELAALFVKWTLSENAVVQRGLAAHKRQWRKYCAAVKVNMAQKGAHYGNQTSKRTTGRSAAADAIERSIELAHSTGGALTGFDG